MPSTMTHANMALDIYSKLDKRIKDKFQNKIGEYTTYSQGPDVMFFYPLFPSYRKYKKIRKFAGRVHRTKVNKFFISLVNEVKKDKDLDKFIWLSGLLTHYVADTTCHPFINYRDQLKRKMTSKNKDYHFTTEAYIDNYILNRKGYLYKKYRGYNYLKTNKNIKIQEMLDKCFYDVYKEKNMGKIYFKCLWNMKFLFHVVRYDAFKIKKIGYIILYYLLPFLKQDIRYFSYNFDLNREDDIFYLNLNHDNWFNVKKRNIVYNKSFLDLYDEVVNKGKIMIEELYDYIYNDKQLDLEIFFGNLSYANGLPIED